ncbi:MAG: DNA polymerase I [Bacteroidaceae bacterium]|nr:DNA polymerase I [Bacteroidaceae bacterium]
MKKLILLDAYALIFRAYYAMIRMPRITSRGMNTSAIYGFVNTLDEVLRKEQPDYIGVAFDPKGGTFRHERYPQYKAQREATPEDIRLAVPYIKQILEGYRIPVLEVPGFEADDVIGTLATKASEIDDMLTLMMTPDKDYGQLVKPNVKMLRPRHASSELEVMGVDEVCAKYGIQSPLQVIDLLGLMGDASDNVPGCPGVGEKTAVKLIQEFGGIDGLIARKGELKGALAKKVAEGEEQIRLSKWLVTINTDVPIDLDLESLSRKEPDMEKLRPIYEELEFRSKIKSTSMPAIGGRSGKNGAGGQLDLFATDSESGGSTHKGADIKATERGNPAADMGDLFATATTSSIASTPHTYRLLQSADAIRRYVDETKDEPIICFDTETTSTEAMTAGLVGLSFAVREGEAVYIPVPADRTEAQQIVDMVRPLYENATTLKVGQNMKYDIMVLAKYGVKVGGKMFDTMIAHYLLHPEMRHGMDYLAEVYLNYQTIHIEQLIGPKGKNQRSMRDVAPADVCDYAAEDADITLRLMNRLAPELREEGLETLFDTIEMPLVPVLAQMEMNGARIDTQSLAETSREFTQRMADIEQKIYEAAGTEFNISSPRQVGEVLFEQLKIADKAKRTKTGQYVTSEEVLQSLKGRHPIVELILDYRGYKKLLSTYIDSLPELINPETGHIHTSYNQAVTATGRLSSSNPNLQNIPIRDENGKEVRKAFIPDEGCLFFSADYSQIELRIMAHLSGDQHMIEAFNTGHDIHAATAAKIFKKPIEEISSDERRKAKTANFGIIYGITTFGLAERMQVSRGEAKELIDEYFATYPAVKAYMEKSVETARERGYTETLFGRRCHLPDINSSNAVVRGYAERNAINAPIQGTAADIIKIAMVRIQRRIEAEGLKSKMILQVHDELNFSVPPEEREQLQRLVIDEMQGAFKMSVPLIADSGWGANWLEAH